MHRSLLRRVSPMLMALLVSLSCTPLLAADAIDGGIGRIKRVSGTVTLDREGQLLPVQPGTLLRQGDRLRTGNDGSVGLTLNDDTTMTAGPGSTLLISRFSFDSTTYDGEMDATLSRGSLHVVSGLIAKRSPDKVNFKARSMVLGVRGTEFIVDVSGDSE